jgi:hypothetical protein
MCWLAQEVRGHAHASDDCDGPGDPAASVQGEVQGTAVHEIWRETEHWRRPAGGGSRNRRRSRATA